MASKPVREGLCDAAVPWGLRCGMVCSVCVFQEQQRQPQQQEERQQQQQQWSSSLQHGKQQGGAAWGEGVEQEQQSGGRNEVVYSSGGSICCNINGGCNGCCSSNGGLSTAAVVHPLCWSLNIQCPIRFLQGSNVLSVSLRFCPYVTCSFVLLYPVMVVPLPPSPLHVPLLSLATTAGGAVAATAVLRSLHAHKGSGWLFCHYVQAE
ncbi:unnamed protein product, partial [Closterium sp. NIES-54]